MEGGSEKNSDGHGVESKGDIMDCDQQQFCLKWNSFGTNLLTASLNLFKNESLSDVTLFCEGKSHNTAEACSLQSCIAISRTRIALRYLNGKYRYVLAVVIIARYWTRRTVRVPRSTIAHHRVSWRAYY